MDSIASASWPLPILRILHSLSLIPREIVACRRLPRQFPHYFHRLWNNIVSSLPIRFGTVGRSSNERGGVSRSRRLTCAEFQHTTKKVEGKMSLLFFISFVFNNL